MSLLQVLEVVGLGPLAMVLAAEGYTEVAQLRSLNRSGDLGSLLLDYGFTDDDVDKVSRVVGFKALAGDGDFFEAAIDSECNGSSQSATAEVARDIEVAKTIAKVPASRAFSEWDHKECLSWMQRSVVFILSPMDENGNAFVQ